MKEKKLLYMGLNSFLLEQMPLQKEFGVHKSNGGKSRKSFNP